MQKTGLREYLPRTDGATYTQWPQFLPFLLKPFVLSKILTKESIKHVFIQYSISSFMQDS